MEVLLEIKDYKNNLKTPYGRHYIEELLEEVEPPASPGLYEVQASLAGPYRPGPLSSTGLPVDFNAPTLKPLPGQENPENPVGFLGFLKGPGCFRGHFR